jgi:hypothetical protein
VISLAYGYLNDRSNTSKYAKRALEERGDIEASFWPGIAELAMGVERTEIGDLTSSCTYLSQSAAKATLKGDKLFEGISRISLGRALGFESRSLENEAETEILRGIGLLDRLEARIYANVGRVFLGELYLKRGEKEKGRRVLQEGAKNLSDLQEEHWSNQAREMLAQPSG